MSRKSREERAARVAKKKAGGDTVQPVGKISSYLKVLNNPYASIMSNGCVYDCKTFIDSGNYMLNALLTGDIYKGIPSNKVIAFAGEEATGKSFLAYGIMRHFLEQNPNGLIFLHESEGASDTETLEAFKIPLDRVLQNPLETVEKFKIQALNLLDMYLKKTPEERAAEPWLWVLDSLSQIPTAKEVGDAVEGKEKEDMTRAKRIRSVFRTIDLKLALAGVPFIINNHVYAEIGAMFPTNKVAGGGGLKFASDYIIILGKSKVNDKDEDGNKTQTGIEVKAKIFKSRKTKGGKLVSFVIDFNKGLGKYSGLTDFCIDSGLITCPTKGYYSWHDTEDKLRMSKIDNHPESFYTEERLTEINVKCSENFKFGGSLKLEADDEGDDEGGDEE